MTGQHLRPLLAFVVVGIVGAVVFVTGLQRPVFEAIQEGASNVVAGTHLLRDRLLVVQDGERITPEPARAGSAGSSAADGGTSTADAGPGPAAPPVASPTAPAADPGELTPTAAAAVPVGGANPGAGRPGGAVNDDNGVRDTRPGHGGAATPGPGADGADGDDEPHATRDDHSGHGKSEVGHDRGPGDGHVARGHDDRGHGKAKGHDRGHDDRGHGKAKGHDRGHDDKGKSHGKGHDKGHGQTKGHPKGR